jgi:hypothetical protein
MIENASRVIDFLNFDRRRVPFGLHLTLYFLQEFFFFPVMNSYIFHQY